MSDVFSTDLYTKLSGVPSLTNAASFTAGGSASDPALTKIPLPAAWVLLGNDKPQDDETAVVPITQIILVEYIVLIYVQYVSQDDLINTQIPLLRAARAAIHGTEGPNRNRWKYMRQTLVLVNPDRLAYEQRYAIRVGM